MSGGERHSLKQADSSAENEVLRASLSGGARPPCAEWLLAFDLYLFDLDGLLVNTEEMHFLAYKKMLERRGFQLLWDFQRYCQTAHYHADTIAGELYALFPELMQQEPSWEVLYAEKKAAMFELIAEGHVQLMAGVEELLTSLLTSGKRCCVVTHSPLDLVAQIRQKQPLLNSIPRWITRHDYQQPKPASECYLKAIATYAEEHEAVVGFEDSPRGLRALMGSRAIAVMISQVDYPEIPQFMAAGARYYRSFVELQVKASAKGAVEREENF